MSVRIDIISIGTLARNLLWNESAARRTGHATTVLISAGKRSIVVNPGLPAPALQARFNERLGGKLESVTDVFLTHIGNDSLSGIELFEHANTAYLVSGSEIVDAVPTYRGLGHAF